MDLRAADSATSLFQHPQGALAGWGPGLRRERGVFPLTGRAPPRATLTRHALPRVSSRCLAPHPDSGPGHTGLLAGHREDPEVIISAISSHGCCHLSGAWTFIIKLSLVGTLELLWGRGLSAILQMRKLSREEFGAFPRSQSE